MFPTESAISNKADGPTAEAAVEEATERAPGSRPAAFLNHRPEGKSRSLLGRVLGILVCLEVGIFLFVAPWSPLWTGFLQPEYAAVWRPILTSPFVRGGLSGVGLLNLWFAFRGVWDFRNAHQAAQPK